MKMWNNNGINVYEISIYKKNKNLKIKTNIENNHSSDIVVTIM